MPAGQEDPGVISSGVSHILPGGHALPEPIPAEGQYCPIGQWLGDELPPGQKDPGGQITVLPARLLEPLKLPAVEDGPGQYLPTGQGSQEVEEGMVDCVPAVQYEQ